MDPLTDRQQEILDFIRDYKQDNGYSPLVDEIKSHFRLSSVNGVIKHLRALEKKGAISRTSKARGIELSREVALDSESTSFRIPLLGLIPAGNPSSFDEFVDGYITVDHNVVDLSVKARPNELFALKVTGDSMIDAGIFEGDVVIAQKKDAKVNDIVVALVDNENTLKRLIKDGGRYFLRAENKYYADIIPFEELVVQGVVISLIRHYA